MSVLTHVSTKPNLTDIRRTPNERQKVDCKPEGFWYSVDGDWERWCREDMPGWLTEFVFDVRLGMERILRIQTLKELDAFHEKYKATLLGSSAEYINWRSVALDYDGIQIAPYQWKRRLEGKCSKWYYVWDCGSGCIWRPIGVTVQRKVTV